MFYNNNCQKIFEIPYTYGGFMIQTDAEEALSPQERRKSDRKTLIVDVSFNGRNETGISNTRDIGIGGLYVTTDADLNTGDEIALQMTFSGEGFNVKGIVAYVDRGVGVGVRFKDLTVEQLNHLKRELEMD